MNVIHDRDRARLVMAAAVSRQQLAEIEPDWSPTLGRNEDVGARLELNNGQKTRAPALSDSLG